MSLPQIQLITHLLATGRGRLYTCCFCTADSYYCSVSKARC